MFITFDSTNITLLNFAAINNMGTVLLMFMWMF